MYLSIGKNTVVREEEILGIFDLDNCSQSRITWEFLSAAEKNGSVMNAAEDIPNSFLLCRNHTLYLTQSSSRTLEKRIKQIHTEQKNKQS
jgi:hypothetical protein